MAGKRFWRLPAMHVLFLCPYNPFFHNLIPHRSVPFHPATIPLAHARLNFSAACIESLKLYFT